MPLIFGGNSLDVGLAVRLRLSGMMDRDARNNPEADSWVITQNAAYREQTLSKCGRAETTHRCFFW
jgi:hypothetical protein